MVVCCVFEIVIGCLVYAVVLSCYGVFVVFVLSDVCCALFGL